MSDYQVVLELLDHLETEVIKAGNKIVDNLDITDARFFKTRLDEFRSLIEHMEGRVIQNAFYAGHLSFKDSPEGGE